MREPGGKRRREGDESKVPMFPPAVGKAALVFCSMSCWPSGTGNGPVWAPEWESHVEAVGGDINDTRMEHTQPKCAGFSLMDCLPSLLPWGR